MPRRASCDMGVFNPLCADHDKQSCLICLLADETIVIGNEITV